MRVFIHHDWGRNGCDVDLSGWPTPVSWNIPDCVCRFFAQTGQERAPNYYQIDLKFNYTFPLSGRANLQIFADIYNLTNQQQDIDIQYARNDKQWDYKDVVEILMPMRFYVGARIRF